VEGFLAMPHSKFLVHWTGHRDLEPLPDHEKKEEYARRLKDWYQNEKRAEELFKQGMTADPTHMSGRFALGRLLVKQGRLAEAYEL
jgi:thioredoxin-like negative regulator of GroEL